MVSGIWAGRNVPELFYISVASFSSCVSHSSWQLLLCKAVLEKQNVTGNLGVAMVNTSVVLKGRDITAYKLY